MGWCWVDDGTESGEGLIGVGYGGGCEEDDYCDTFCVLVAGAFIGLITFLLTLIACILLPPVLFSVTF